VKKYALMRPTSDDGDQWSLMVTNSEAGQSWAPWWEWAHLNRDELLTVNIRAHLFTVAYHVHLQHPDHFCHTLNHATFHPDDHTRLLDLCTMHGAIYVALDVAWEAL
jgi:hypothetical protein